MKNKPVFSGWLIAALPIGLALAGCVSAPAPKEAAEASKAQPVAQGTRLYEILSEYAGPSPQTWDNEPVSVYFIDPLRFEAFKAELDAGGEYKQAGSWTETRDWDKGVAFARWAARPNGEFELRLCKADNSTLGYRYVKLPAVTEAVGPKARESLRKYTGPQPQKWDEGPAYAYFLDPLRFEAFRAALVEAAEGEWYPADSWTETRDWDRGKLFARFIVRPDGDFETDICREDNSTTYYWYVDIKPHNVGDTWDEDWDEGRITFTYLGLDDPGFILDTESDKDGGRPNYKGYYKMTYHDEGGRTVYLYYPESGRAAQYSVPLN